MSIKVAQRQAVNEDFEELDKQHLQEHGAYMVSLLEQLETRICNDSGSKSG